MIEIAKRKIYNEYTDGLLMLNINSTRETVKQALSLINGSKPNFCVVLHELDTEPFQWVDLRKSLRTSLLKPLQKILRTEEPWINDKNMCISRKIHGPQRLEYRLLLSDSPIPHTYPF